MSAVLIRIFQVILALSVLIAFHELGHYTFARIFGIRVDKFFLFFDIGGHKLLSTKEGWFSRLFPSLKKSETEYGIGWLPLGGYCKINGMIDESMDSSFTEHEPRPWEFRSKPAWQRLLVMLGGVLFNFIFAILMFVLILGIWGQSYLSNDENAIYTTEGELAYDMGFRTGDRILSLDDYVPENFGMLQADIARRSVHKATVLRGADTLEIYIDQARIPEILNTPGMFQVAVPFVVDTIPPSSPNYGAGILRGDRIVEVDGQHIDYVQDSRLVLGSRASTSVPAKIVRGGDTLATTIAVDSTGKALIYAHVPGLEVRRYSPISAIPAGIKMTGSMMKGYLQDLKMVATPSTGAYKSVGSFVAIGEAFPAMWDWNTFLYMLAVLSVMLGIMNLIPIPGLDGGHVAFTLYEMATRRKPSVAFLEGAQIVGLFLVMMLMFLAFGNDIGRLIR